VSEEHIPREAKEILDKLRQDMYYGNGKPGITTRVHVLETWQLETFEQWKGQMETKVDTLYAWKSNQEERLHARLNLLIGASLSSLFALIGGIILLILKIK
jgi:hypothetical protein